MGAVRPESGASFPPELAKGLREAARVADYDRLGELIATIPPEHARMAEDLRQLVQRYAYDEIERSMQFEGNG
jgi:hypothetical protein